MRENTPETNSFWKFFLNTFFTWFWQFKITLFHLFCSIKFILAPFDEMLKKITVNIFTTLFWENDYSVLFKKSVACWSNDAILVLYMNVFHKMEFTASWTSWTFKTWKCWLLIFCGTRSDRHTPCWLVGTVRKNFVNFLHELAHFKTVPSH